MPVTLEKVVRRRKISRFIKRLIEFVLFISAVAVIAFIFLNAPSYIHKLEHKINQTKIKAEFEEKINKEDLVNNSLIIPKAGIYVPIIFSESSDKEKLDEDLKEGAVHLPESSLFDKKGLAVIFGHSSNYFWRGGKYNFIFSTLSALREEDEIYIRYNNRTIKYTVTDKETVLAKEFNMLEEKGGADLKLVTYRPIGLEFYRLVIYATK
jgi:LPXTG-site transpeptidase (sortase) family protein